MARGTFAVLLARRPFVALAAEAAADSRAQHAKAAAAVGILEQSASRFYVAPLASG
jgi:hypothetical protein